MFSNFLIYDFLVHFWAFLEVVSELLYTTLSSDSAWDQSNNTFIFVEQMALSGPSYSDYTGYISMYSDSVHYTWPVGFLDLIINTYCWAEGWLSFDSNKGAISSGWKNYLISYCHAWAIFVYMIIQVSSIIVYVILWCCARCGDIISYLLFFVFFESNILFMSYSNILAILFENVNFLCNLWEINYLSISWGYNLDSGVDEYFVDWAWAVIVNAYNFLTLVPVDILLVACLFSDILQGSDDFYLVTSCDFYIYTIKTLCQDENLFFWLQYDNIFNYLNDSILSMTFAIYVILCDNIFSYLEDSILSMNFAIYVILCDNIFSYLEDSIFSMNFAIYVILYDIIYYFFSNLLSWDCGNFLYLGFVGAKEFFYMVYCLFCVTWLGVSFELCVCWLLGLGNYMDYIFAGTFFFMYDLVEVFSYGYSLFLVRVVEWLYDITLYMDYVSGEIFFFMYEFIDVFFYGYILFLVRVVESFYDVTLVGVFFFNCLSTLNEIVIFFVKWFFFFCWVFYVVFCYFFLWTYYIDDNFAEILILYYTAIYEVYSYWSIGYFSWVISSSYTIQFMQWFYLGSSNNLMSFWLSFFYWLFLKFVMIGIEVNEFIFAIFWVSPGIVTVCALIVQELLVMVWGVFVSWVVFILFILSATMQAWFGTIVIIYMPDLLIIVATYIIVISFYLVGMIWILVEYLIVNSDNAIYNYDLFISWLWGNFFDAYLWWIYLNLSFSAYINVYSVITQLYYNRIVEDSYFNLITWDFVSIFYHLWAFWAYFCTYMILLVIEFILDICVICIFSCIMILLSSFISFIDIIVCFFHSGILYAFFFIIVLKFIECIYFVAFSIISVCVSKNLLLGGLNTYLFYWLVFGNVLKFFCVYLLVLTVVVNIMNFVVGGWCYFNIFIAGMVNNLFDVYVFSSFFSSFFNDFLGIVSSLVGIFSFSFVTIINFLLLFIFFVFLIATITLVERKVLALLQRRVGPNYVGYRGRLQFIADAVKLVAKQITTAPVVNSVLYLTLPPTVLVLSFLFWANLVWCPSLAICEIEYNLFFLCLLSGLFSILVVIIGFLSNNRYAMLSVARVILLSLNAEILFSFLIVSLSIISNSVSFVGVANFQDSFYWHIFIFLPIFPILIVSFLLETNSIPFDVVEAESELVAGYTTEYGGFFFVLFYLSEYFHLYCSAVVYVIIFFGAWYN